MENCHQLAKAATSEEDHKKVSLEAEYLLMKCFQSFGEPCENAQMTVKVSTEHLISEIKSLEYVATGACPIKSTVTGLPSKLATGREVSFRLNTRYALGEEIVHGGELV